MQIGFVGAGRLGTAFGIYLVSRAQQVSGYYSRTYAHAQEAAQAGAGSQAFFSIDKLLESSDWIAITTKDGVIADVAALMAKSPVHIEGKIIFHMSGAGTSALLKPLAEKGALVASLHPLQTFADSIFGARAMEQAAFSIEGDAEAVKRLGIWLDKLGHTHFSLNAQQKPLYHAAASIASNSLAGVIGYAVELMKEIGVEENKALSGLSPLIETTVRNVMEKGPAQALTGPIARGDVGTVETHLRALSMVNPELVPFYKMLGQITLSLAMREQLQNEQAICDLNALFEK